MNKYLNRVLDTPDGKFDSVKEYRRWCELKLMERAGIITQLSRQTQFELIPSQKVNGKVVERAVTYNADFTYYQNGEYVCEDTKSPITRTKDYIIKRKLMLYVHGLQIKEV